MIFSALNIYRIAHAWEPIASELEKSMASFAPCRPSQEKSIGWVPPRGEAHGALVESVNGHLFAKLMIETKSVPASAIKKAVDEACKNIESTTGRTPGKKERREFKDDAYFFLLPQAFPRQKVVNVWVDIKNQLLMTDAASASANDEAITALVRAFDGLALAPVLTKTVPQAAMSSWLSSEQSSEDLWVESLIDVGRSCELRSEDESKAVVRFKNHDLENDEVRKHIADGKLPSRLELVYNGRVLFTLDEHMGIKGIKFLEAVFDGKPNEDEDLFDADAVLTAGELAPLIKNLIGALGGEVAIDNP